MSTATATHAHISYDLIADDDVEVVVIEFLSRELVGAQHAEELAEQLDSLVYADLPRNFVIDFSNVCSLGSTAFAAIAGFVRRACRVRLCNLDATLRLGAALTGLEGRVEFFDSRRAAVRAAGRDARRGEEDTIDYP